MSSKKKAKKYTVEELWNPQIDLSSNAAAYGRQSTKEQVIEHIQSHISQTVGLLNEAKAVGFKDDGSTGKVILFVENQVVDEDGNTQIKNASGTWPIDRRPDLKAILDLIEEGKIKLVIVEFVDRLFRDEDRIDSNIFIKTCKENGCFVYVTSKKLIYNFANPQMAEMFRMEVQFAAAYIEHHVRGTMLRRRDQAVSDGKYGGGFIPMGLVRCLDKENKKNYKKYVIYEPHAKIIRELAVRVIQLGFLEVRRQAIKEPIFFPDFEEGVEPGIRALEKVEGGYVVSSRSGLEHMLKNRAYVGDLIWSDIKVNGAHKAILDKETFDLLQEKLKEDGLIHRRGYYHKNTKTERPGTLKDLLCSDEWRSCTYSRTKEKCYYYYFGNRGLVVSGIAISADTLESLVENRLLERIRDCDLGDFEEELKERNKAKLKRIKDIDTRLLAIKEEIGNLATDLKKTNIQIMIDEINAQAAKLQQEITPLNVEKKSIEDDLKESELSIEEELSGLNIMEKPAPIRKAILEFLIQKIQVELVSTRFVRVDIFWKVPEFGMDRIFIDRGKISTHWEDWELEVLKSMYPTENSIEILKCLPDRTWQSCQIRGSKLKLHRDHEYRDNGNTDNQLTWKDRQFLDTMGKDFLVGKWCQVSQVSVSR